MNTLETVAITAPTLPNPLPTDWQALTDCFYGYWQDLSRQVRENNASLKEGCDNVWIDPSIPGMLREPTQDEIAAVMPAKVNAAVVLANFNYQVGNGGVAQYIDNRYAGGLPTLITLFTGAKALEIKHADEALAIVEEIVKRMDEAERYSPRMGYFEEDEDEPGDVYGDLDRRWYAFETEPMCQAVLDRFTDILEASFRPVMRMAA